MIDAKQWGHPHYIDLIPKPASAQDSMRGWVMNEKQMAAISKRKLEDRKGPIEHINGIHFKPDSKPLKPDSNEVTVDWVDLHSNAFVARLRPGDVIESANLEIVHSVDELRSIIHSSKNNTLLLLIKRRNGKRYIAIDRQKESECRV